MNLTPGILRAIQDLGFENPMPVQEEVIPLMLDQQNDIIALAQTGTGKTAAFGLPLVQMTDISSKEPQALVLCPTRELCIQITADLQSFAVHTPGLNILAVYGGSSIENQLRALKKGVHIIVATPGRLWDLMGRKAVKLHAVSNVVLDEADEMLNMGFEESIADILEQVPSERRTLLFSATMPREVANIARKYMQEALEVTIGTRNAGSNNVSHIAYSVHGRDKYRALKRVADAEPAIYGIVFCRTRRDTHEIASKLIADGYNADALHGDLSQAQRDSVMNKFRQRSIQLLVATDVAARGLDVDDLTHIINFDLPDDLEAYTHRSGRTGRANKKGISIALVSPRERTQLAQIQRKMKVSFSMESIPTGKEICSNQMMHWVQKLDTVSASHHQLRKMVPGVYDTLEQLDKDELIRRMAGLEFEKLLSEYSYADDLAIPDHDNTRSNGREKYKNRGLMEDSEGYTRLFINLGKMDGLYPKELIGLVNDNTRGERINLGRIDLMREFSFFEVENQQVKTLIKSMKNSTFRNRRVDVTIANPEGKPSSPGKVKPAERRKKIVKAR
ncbi:MAG: DEAD/DEAH box helicase [Bacteroidales bacterium]|nr:DEAD/DEAH box helicase [Bacteroidales bacterium]